MKKFWGLLALLCTLAMIVVGCGGGVPAKPTADPAKPFAGKTIRFVASNHNWTEVIKPMIPEFEKQTGIKVNMESYEEQQLTPKLTTEFTSNASTIDVFMTRPLQEGRLFSKNKWYEPLNPYLADIKKTPADWDWKDFKKSAVDAVTLSDSVYAIPIVTEGEIIYYRKDLFEKAGVKVPTTLDELEAAAKKLNDPTNGVYGVVMRGQRNPSVTQFSGVLFSFGGDFIKNGKCVLDSPEALKAFQYYGRLLKNYGPPGVTNMSWPQAQALFQSGKVAMWIDASVLGGPLLDKAKSAVYDKVGYAVFPAGPAGAKPFEVVPWALAISAQSKNKDAAWEFAKWLTSKDIMTRAIAKQQTVARTSAWADKEATKNWPAGFAEVSAKTGQIAVPYDRPLMTAVVEARDAIGDVIVKSIETGGTADLTPMLKEVVIKVNELLAKNNEGGK
ncbi:MAG TPA: extracellular solute-binding protein [Negativicutes bacterium]|nr:extracellular solute-binding protein [Negativicutes bacterium]